MLMWPSVAALGFVALTAVVIALGAGLTARYEFERARARRSASEQPSTVSAAAGRHPSGGSVAAVSRQSGPRAPHAVDGLPTPVGDPQRTAVGC
jgi:hypothetical protein